MRGRRHPSSMGVDGVVDVGAKDSRAQKQQPDDCGFDHDTSPYLLPTVYRPNVSGRFRGPVKMVSRGDLMSGIRLGSCGLLRVVGNAQVQPQLPACWQPPFCRRHRTRAAAHCDMHASALTASAQLGHHDAHEASPLPLHRQLLSQSIRRGAVQSPCKWRTPGVARILQRRGRTRITRQCRADVRLC